MLNNRSLFSCPVCGGEMEIEQRQYACQNGHRFDRAANGYVNLLLPNRKNSADPGDDRKSLQARRAFLRGGHYEALAKTLREMSFTLCGANPVMLDCCCGEGYYTEYVGAVLKEEKGAVVAGFDISKHGAKMASGMRSGIEYAAASVFRIPVHSEKVSLALHCFAPYCDEELTRILRPGGVLLGVIPGRRHLFGLKELLYSQPYENDEAGYNPKELICRDHVRITGELSLSAQQALSLFEMTPYYYRSEPQARERLLANGGLQTEIEFIVQVLEKRR